MSEQPVIQISLKCPSCGYENLMGSVICSGCGINMRSYQANEEKIIDLLQENQTDTDPKNRKNKINPEQKDDRLQYRKKISATIAISIGLGLVVIAVSLLFGYQLEQRRNKAAESFAAAQSCFEKSDYECASEAVLKASKYGFKEEEVRQLQVKISLESAKVALSADLPEIALEHLVTCLGLQPNNISCVQTACTARTMIAERYVATARWEEAVTLLDEIITGCPNLSDSRSLQEDAFNRWYENARRQGNLLEMNRIKQLWNARFPKE
jgi:uncharacterized Zn finger protein (UPF0148 family)